MVKGPRTICPLPTRAGFLSQAIGIAVVVILGFGSFAEAEPIRVFVVAGQSNAVGSDANAAVLPETLDPQPDVLFWYELGDDDSVADPNERISSDGWISLSGQPDLGLGTFSNPVGFGPEIQMGRALAESSTDNLAILKFAINGTDLSSQWRAGSGVLYLELISLVQTALSDLVSMGYTPTLSGVFWMQGESDALTAGTALQYDVNLTDFIAEVRTDLAEPDLPFILGRISISLSLTGSFPGLFAVRMAQQAVAFSDPWTRQFSTDELSMDSDNIHFDSQGQLGLGQLAAEAFAALSGNGEFILLDPSPGIAGQFNDFSLFGGEPEKRVYFVFGFDPGSIMLGDCPLLKVQISNPVSPGRTTLDSMGSATLNLRVPPGLSGRTILIQVLDRRNCRVSNLVEFPFP